MDSLLPSYKRQKAFTRYSLLIGRAVDLYPQPYKHTPEGEAMETFRRNITQAIKAGLEFGYRSTLVNHERFVLIGHDLTCLMRSNFCWIGSKDNIKAYETTQREVPILLPNTPGTTRPIIDFTGDPTQLALMLSAHAFTPCPIFQLTCNPDQMLALADKFDLAVEQDVTVPSKWRVV